VRVAGEAEVSTTRPVIASILRALPYERLPAHLRSPWPGVRRGAAEELGHRDRWSVIPSLIERLEDDDADVRVASASALRRLTNQFFGFGAEGGPREQAAIASRWRAWWNLEGHVRANEREGTSRPS
jgi:hypothetical protein